MGGNSHAEIVMSAVSRNSRVPRAHATWVKTSWERCVAKYGLEPHRVAYPTIVTEGELKKYREPIDDLVSLAASEMDRLFVSLTQHDYIVSLTDAAGVTVLFRSDEPSCRNGGTSGVLLGAIWSEESQGTNGIGTCIAERRPISVVMRDHFGEGLVGLSCTVAPIFAGGGKLAAVLNVTTGRPSDYTTQSIVREIVCRSARRIENRYFERQHAGHELLRISRYDDFSDLGVEVRMALDSSGRIVDASHDAARTMSNSQASLIGRPLAEVTTPELASWSRAGTSPEAMVVIGERRLFVRRIENSSRLHAQRIPPRPLARRPSAADDVAVLTANDPAMRACIARAQKLVDRQLPILLQGETGCGKTALAKALHTSSIHRNGSFVSINCAAIPAELIESELFGYRPGAFTGANKQGAKGRIAEANGGTLFLDEIGDMPLHLQTRFLQVLSDGEFVPVGGSQPVKVRFALISATLHDIDQLVKKSRFREDLYFRLNGSTLALPPLRQRSDKRALIENIFQSEAIEAGAPRIYLDDEVRRLLFSYSWPGNIRELRHVARFAVTLAENFTISPRDLPAPLNPLSPNEPTGTGAAERQAIEQMLGRTGWNVSLAAQQLGISRATMHRRIAALGLRRCEGNGKQTI